ncbi:MAG: cysteine hydrolase [Bryobacterales bacterium]|nr:cysteine hydrolase [Bryobacterales bacterium]
MRTAFFDVDTQLDFLYPAGALYVPKAEALEPGIAALNRLAALHGIVVISTMDAHTEDDIEFHQWPPHCVSGTAGQHKPASTLLDRRVTVPSAPMPWKIEGAHQILLEKQTTDCFTNANLTALLDALQVQRAVVYGVVTEICVKNAALGLLNTGRQVEVVTDAVECLNEAAAREFYAELTRRGGRLVDLASVEAEIRSYAIS